MSRRPTEDATLLCEIAPLKSCPRRLRAGQVKRYLSKGPLVGYMVACPSCGFIELHLKERAGFVEEEGVLVCTTSAVGCMLCGRSIRVFTEEGVLRISATA